MKKYIIAGLDFWANSCRVCQPKLRLLLYQVLSAVASQCKLMLAWKHSELVEFDLCPALFLMFSMYLF